MGDVWMARDTDADPPVALKFIKPHLLDDPGFRTRFLNEARTLGRLEHDRVVTLYTVLDHDGHMALVLRFIDGQSGGGRIDSRGPLPVDFVLACARDILPALGFAHERGEVTHRDIKPQNILVDRQDRSFLTDFGIAVGDFLQRGTVTGFAVGILDYMSPEQIQTPRDITMQNGGHRTDIYSFGITLDEMLAGRLPFGGDSDTEAMYRIQHAHCVDAPPPLREANPRIPAGIEAVVLSCLEKNPDDRFQKLAANCFANSKRQPRMERARRMGARGACRHRGGTAGRAAGEASGAQRPAAPARSRRGLPKAAWLGFGGALIAGGILFAVLSRPPAPTPAKTDTPPVQKTDSSPPPNIGGRGQEGTRQPPVKPVPKPEDTAATVNARKAADSYRAANALLLQHKYCEGNPQAGQAVTLDPQPQYIDLRQRMDDACKAAGLYNEAQQLNSDAKFCPATKKMEEAVNLMKKAQLLSANPDYESFYKKTGQFCDLNGQ